MEVMILEVLILEVMLPKVMRSYVGKGKLQIEVARNHEYAIRTMSCRFQVEICVVREEDHISDRRCPRARCSGRSRSWRRDAAASSLRLRSPGGPTGGGEPGLAGRVAQALRGVHQADDGLELLQRFVT